MSANESSIIKMLKSRLVENMRETEILKTKLGEKEKERQEIMIALNAIREKGKEDIN